MTKEDFLYALENEGLINCERDEKNTIDVEETIDSYDCTCGTYTNGGEWLSIEKIFRIIEDIGGFED